MVKKIMKVSLAVVLLAAVSPLSVFAQEGTSSKFDLQRKEAINQELIQKGYGDLSSQSLQKITLDPTTQNNIDQLKKAEIVLMNFDEAGHLDSAESSVNGDTTSHFVKETRKSSKDVQASTSTKNLSPTGEVQSAITPRSILNDTTPAPAGSDTGAFHRLATPASNSSLSYTGGVADDVTLPGYNFANSDGEAAYLYTGIDQAGVGIAEVGFGTYNGTKGQGWFPLFHARASHTVTTQPGNEPDSAEYYYDYTKNYGSGNKTITGYKVYYKTTDANLTVTYQVGFSTIYVVKFGGYDSQNKAVKRVTAIAMPKGTTGKFKNGYTSYANWGNYRFLTQNGVNAVYPGSVSNLVENAWSHGGSIDYIKNVISTTDRDEQYRIY